MELPPIRNLVPIDRVWARLEKVERRLREATTSDDPYLTRIAQHLLAGGKRYRPMLAQVAAEIGGDSGDAPVEAGVSVELIHLGSLYHDDVIDDAGAIVLRSDTGPAVTVNEGGDAYPEDAAASWDAVARDLADVAVGGFEFGVTCSVDSECRSGVCWDLSTYDELCAGMACTDHCASDDDWYPFDESRH